MGQYTKSTIDTYLEAFQRQGITMEQAAYGFDYAIDNHQGRIPIPSANLIAYSKLCPAKKAKPLQLPHLTAQQHEDNAKRFAAIMDGLLKLDAKRAEEKKQRERDRKIELRRQANELGE